MSTLRVSQAHSLPKAATGITGLDEITGGGLPRGRPTLVSGRAGCGKTLFAVEFLVRGATRFGEPGVFVAFEETAEELAQNVRSLGFDLDRLVARKQLLIDIPKLKGPQEPELQTPIEMIERQTEQLARLLDDLLDVSRITRGALEMRSEGLTLSDVVDASVDACHDQIRDHRAQLQVSLPAEAVDLIGDRARLIQLLCNLLTNAAKYTPVGGKIELKATTMDGTLTLSIKDNGIGIPRERLGEIFDLFAQVDRSGGLGIGLPRVRQIAMLHHGNIEAPSDGVGHGSEFILTFPLAALGTAKPATVAPSAPAVIPRRILVVDDSRDAAESLAALLQIAGHDVRHALDGEAAIAIAEQSRPDIMILDLGMPRVSGYDVVRRIRERPWGKNLYMVALSGWGQADERLRTQEAGFDAHFVKPIAPEALNRIIETWSAGIGHAAAH